MKCIKTIEVAAPLGMATCAILRFNYKGTLRFPDWTAVDYNAFDNPVYSTGIPEHGYHSICASPDRSVYAYVGDSTVWFNINPHYRQTDTYKHGLNAILTKLLSLFADNELHGLRFSKVVFKILDEAANRTIAGRFSPKLARYAMDWNKKRLFLYKDGNGYAVENCGNGDGYLRFIDDLKAGTNCVFGI